MAGTWQLPVVFVVNNNQWAISTPRRIQSGARTLAQKAIGAGIAGEQVDGNDLLALHRRLTQAIARARPEQGRDFDRVLNLPFGRSHHRR